MSKLRCQISISLDGFIAGPNQSVENPLGEGGMALHEWVFKLDAWRRSHGQEGGEANASSAVIEEATSNIGAVVMGRNMFGGGPGPWGEEPWNGWWGDDPPFHTPVFVLTHHQREPLEMDGGTTFHFVTDGVESALERAREAAGGRDVSLGGGARAVQQYLAAGLLDELQLNVVPILLGGGSRLFDDLAGADVRLEPARVIDAPGVTHLLYGVAHDRAR
jgi:dihydrofolate reductase